MASPAGGPDALHEAGILYSQCWEDVACARAAFRIQAGERVLAIGAAGDNVLALLLDEPAEVIAVDVNPAQCALVELKRAAISSLATEEVGPFLGHGDHTERLALYEQIRLQLTAEAARRWDAAPHLVAEGVLHVGRFERALGLFRRFVLPTAPGRSTIRAMLGARNLAEQERLFRTRWDTPLWRALFRTFFSRRVLAAIGRHPAMFERCEVRDVGAHYLARARVGLSEVPIQTNPYAAWMLGGAYDTPARTPLYLQQTSLTRLKSLVDRLEVRRES